MKDVLIINGWSDDNKGDAAITQGLITTLGSVLGSGAGFTIISNFSRRSPSFQRHYRYTREITSNVKVMGSLLPVATLTRNRVAKVAVRLGLLLQSLLILAFAPWPWFHHLLRKDRRDSLLEFIQAGLVISKGGHIYFAKGDLASLVSLYQNLFPLLLAQRLGKPTVVYAQSIGPIERYLQRHLAGIAFRNTDAIYTRELLSLKVVNELLGEEGAKFAWDTAFCIPAAELPRAILASLPDRFIAITVRQWEFPYQGGGANELYTRYLNTMAGLIRRIEQDLHLDVVLVPQVIGPTEYENDYIAMEDIGNHLDGHSTIMLKGDFTPGQLRSIYGRAELLVGTRFHSVILALAAGTPALAISYHGYKAKGIMDLLGLPELVFDIDHLNQAHLEETLLRTFANRSSYQETIQERVRAIVRQSREEMQGMLASLDLA